MEDNRVHKRSKVLKEPNRFSNLKEMLTKTRTKYPDEYAFTFKTDTPDVFRHITYREYGEQIDSFGTALINAGLKGKRVAIISENRYEWMLTYLTVTCGVGVIAPLDKSLPKDELINSINRSEVEAIVYSSKYEETMNEINGDPANHVKYFISMDKEKSEGNMYSLQEMLSVGKDLIGTGDRRYLDAEIDNEALAVMLFTSGTTAMAKIVMLSHRNICSNLVDIDSTFDVTKDDTYLSFLPLHHVFECTVAFLYATSQGAKIAFCEGLRHIADNVREYHITCMIVVPALIEAIYRQLWKNIEKNGKTKKVKKGLKISKFLLKFGIDRRRKIFKEIIDGLGGKLRLLVSGGAALDKETEIGFNDFGIATYQGYGLTETAPVIAAEHMTVQRYGSIGMLFPSVEGKIMEPDEDGIGELVIKSPTVMIGYMNNEEATKEAIDEDGWFHTGDLAYFDKDDFLFITGRKKSVIVLQNGKNIFPEELEMLIDKLDGVKESFVYGKADPKDKDNDLKLGVKVVYDPKVMKDKFNLTTEEEIKEKLWNDIKEINKTMPKYKYIKGIIVTTEPLIKTTTLKIKRFEEIKTV
ncbi:MAG: AMP-binding protein [Clostridia bacterium]|nr:AMP-binding protein [Clostridia bacterium]